MSQSAPVYSFVADALLSRPDVPQPTNFSDRNESQNVAFLDFQAWNALFSNATTSPSVNPVSETLSVAAEAFAPFACAFPAQAAYARAVIAVNVIPALHMNCPLRN